MWHELMLTLLIGAITADVAEQGTTGRLWIDGTWRDVACGELIDGTDASRPFVVYEPKEGYRLGILPAHERAIRCRSEALLLVDVAAQPTPASVELRIEGTAPNAVWWIPLTGKDLRGHVPLRLEAGTYELIVEAPHFVRFTKQIRIEKPRGAIAVALMPLPRLSGTVFDRISRRPLTGAVIRSDTGCEAGTDAKGRFSVEADPNRWPRSITISAAGFGDRTLSVPPAKADASFDDIYLDDAASIIVELHPQRTGQVEQVELEKLRENGRAPGPTVRTLPVGAVSRLRLENVEPGQYVVIAKGHLPWQRLGKRVDVAERDEIVVPMQIEPFTVRFRVPRASSSSHGRIVLRNLEAFWEAILPFDESAPAIDLWQGGKMAATVDTAGYTPYIVKRTLASDVASEWSLEPPSYEVTGRVTDSESGAGIPGAAVSLRIKASDGYALTVTTLTAGDGSFHFAPVAPGLHVISAAAKGYPRSDASYEFTDAETAHNVTLQLVATPFTRLIVTDAQGAPLSGAHVLDTRSGEALGITDAAGIARVFVSEGSTRDVAVVPLDGSFGFVRIKSGVPEASLPIAAGSARIVLQVETEAHEPISGITAALRYNGTTIPLEVMQALSSRGSRTLSDARGRIVFEHMPPGVYEVWPIASPSDLRAMRGGQSPELTLRVSPGENLTILTFSRGD